MPCGSVSTSAARYSTSHARGFVHLDVKPANVIVVHGRPVLFDFGTARSRDGRRPPDPVGTDPYIAPEECLCERATPAADVFGLGVTLYELLTGELPFPKGTRKQPFTQLHKFPVLLARQHRRGIPEETRRSPCSVACRAIRRPGRACRSCCRDCTPSSAPGLRCGRPVSSPGTPKPRNGSRRLAMSLRSSDRVSPGEA